MSTFKRLLNGNKKSSRIGLQITLKQTLYLITKFIINTRLNFSQRLKWKLGDLENGSPWKKVDEKLQVHLSMCWLKKLACKDQLECQFRPEFMNQGGTLNDFINAIAVTRGGEKTESIILHIRGDWQSFLNLVTKLGKTVGVDMREINSLLSQRSLSICTQTNCLEILP